VEVVKDLRRLFPTVMDRAYEQSKEFRRVSDIMSPDVITISPEASMDGATKIMGGKHIGSHPTPASSMESRSLLGAQGASTTSRWRIMRGLQLSSPGEIEY